MQYNVKALWTHPNVDAIDLKRNIGMEIPHASISLPSLTYLHLGENKITINTQFDKKQFPRLAFLYLNGNDLLQFPDESLRDNLVKLGVARCNLKSLPFYLSEFKTLQYCDARDNNITNVDERLKQLIQNNEMESYFSGNPVCNTDGSLDCEPICSKTCWSRKVSGDGICDETCTAKECDYDGGDCPWAQ